MDKTLEVQAFGRDIEMLDMTTDTVHEVFNESRTIAELLALQGITREDIIAALSIQRAEGHQSAESDSPVIREQANEGSKKVRAA
jgi:hypothetical protein